MKQCRGHRPVLDTCANEAIPRWGKGGLINHLYLQVFLQVKWQGAKPRTPKDCNIQLQVATPPRESVQVCIRPAFCQRAGRSRLSAFDTVQIKTGISEIAPSPDRFLITLIVHT